MDVIVSYFALDSVGASEVQEFYDDGVDGYASKDCLDVWDTSADCLGRYGQRYAVAQQVVVFSVH
jgi:hypothetical protein